MNTHRWQIVAYYLELLGLAVWVGGLLMIMAVVIPAVFNSVGMEPGGRFLRRLFDGYNHVTLAVFGYLVFVAGVRRWQQSRGERVILFSGTTVETLVLLLMGVLISLILWGVGPQAAALQEQAFQATTEADKQSAYDQFFRLHMMIRAMHLVNLACAVWLFVFKVRRGLMIASTIHRGNEQT